MTSKGWKKLPDFGSWILGEKNSFLVTEGYGPSQRRALRSFPYQHPTSNIQYSGSPFGFTLLELVAVLFILTLGAALIAPRFGRSFGQVQLRAAARDVAALCRFARTQAISHQGVLEVVLDRRTNAYWLRGPDWIVGRLGGIEQAATAEDPGQPWQAQMRQARVRSLPAGITLKSVVLNMGPLGEDERGAIAFFPQGSSTGGEVWVSDEKGRGYRIMIDSSVGLVRVRAATTT